MSLRSALISVCAATLALGLSACAPTASPASSSDVVMGLTYIPNVQFAPAYVASAHGGYAGAGVNVTLRHHGSDEGLFTALLAGQENVVIASGDEAAVAVSQGLDLVSIGSYYRTYPGVVIVPADSSISTLEDLRGHTIGIPGEYGSTYYATLAALSQGGLSTSDVTISSIGYTQASALSQGAVDAVVGFSNNDAVQMRASGIDIREIPLAQDTPLVGASIITTRAWAQAHPDQARAIVTATAAAMEQIAADPSSALDASAQWDTTLSDASARDNASAVLSATIPLWVGSDGVASGQQNEQTWAQMLSFLSSIGAMDTSVLPSTVVTNEYATSES